MHYECELAVVIGATARNVFRADALRHVAGYTVCNDYALRDNLENWYLPNLPTCSEIARRLRAAFFIGNNGEVC